jgi:hypothetical protein
MRERGTGRGIAELKTAIPRTVPIRNSGSRADRTPDEDERYGKGNCGTKNSNSPNSAHQEFWEQGGQNS